MAKAKTKTKIKINWWIIIIAFIVGLLIGTFVLANLFGKKVSLSPVCDSFLDCIGASGSTKASCCKSYYCKEVCAPSNSTAIKTLFGKRTYKTTTSSG